MTRRLLLLACLALPATALADPPANAGAVKAELKAAVGALAPSLQRLKRALSALSGPAARRAGAPNEQAQRGRAAPAIAEAKAAQAIAVRTQKAFEKAAASLGPKGKAASEGAQLNRTLADQLGGLVNDLEGADHMGNFEMQDLMSKFNQSEQLASSIQQRANATLMSIIQNIR